VDVYFITIFPQMFENTLGAGVLGIAARKESLRYHVVNLRDFSEDKHGNVDDYPYGGGPGMVMMAPPIVKAVEHIQSVWDAHDAPVVLLSPVGRKFNQKMAGELAGFEKLIFICGRYKGVDERIKELVVTDVVSIGDYVLSGGELPALVITEAVARNIPGVLGDQRSGETDSFSAERGYALDASYYTRPAEFRSIKVPEVLISGDHAAISAWRRESARKNTIRYRPDLANEKDLEN
jgi:tRNA (guanine37-N1)-methyltransferase